MTSTIKYQVQPAPEKHLLDVTCIIENPNPQGQTVTLPAWIPGSYLVRDFARHVVTLRAEALGVSVPVRMLDKNTWHCDPTLGPLVISYQVYAFDLTPRGAYVDNTHAFFNGSRVFIQIKGAENNPCCVEILPPIHDKYRHWRVATSMPQKVGQPYQFGMYHADNYEDLIDHPIQIGDFTVTTFQVSDVSHELIITGQHKGDIERLSRDLARICDHHIQFFTSPAPMKRYVFLLTVLGEGYGGLEHRFSSVLHCRRDHLPGLGESGVSDGYRTLLGLLSHEYFHTWNIKRIKPKAFIPYDLERENYTKLLWVFEGITSYYDELALVRAKLISKESYLELLEQTITRVYSTPGRFKQTLEQSSFEAWTKFYKPDENSLNATISYYLKGALVAMALDLLLRQKTQKRCSLDDVMRALWQQYGLTGQGLPEDGFERLVEELSGCNFKEFFDTALRSTKDFPLESLMKEMGLELRFRPSACMDETNRTQSVEPPEKLTSKPMLEVKLKSFGSEAQLAHVIEGSAAQAAGLAPHDIIIAVNGLKVDRQRLESQIASYAIGEEIVIHAFRRDELMTFKVTLNESWMQTSRLTPFQSMTEIQQENFDAWLGIER